MSIASNISKRLQQNLTDFNSGLNTFLTALPLSREWVQREWLLSDGNDARILLAAAKIAFLEAGTAWAIGLNRGAVSSLRVYVESAFAWLYYKDHPVEFSTVSDRKMEMLLPKGVQSYLRSVDGGFERAYMLLDRKKKRPNEYFYTDISHFVHAHPAFAEALISVEETTVSVPRDTSFLTLSIFADEFISDNYSACYRGSWGDIPALVQANVEARLGKTLKQFVDIV